MTAAKHSTVWKHHNYLTTTLALKLFLIFYCEKPGPHPFMWGKLHLQGYISRSAIAGSQDTCIFHFNRYLEQLQQRSLLVVRIT